MLSAAQLQHLGLAPRALALLLIEDAKQDTCLAMEIAVRLANDQSATEIMVAMDLTRARYSELRKRAERAARRMG
jgi:hypothetical protein